MKILFFILTLVTLLQSKILVIETEDVLGKCAIEYGDTVIMHYGNNLEHRLSQLPIDLVMCGSSECVDNTISKMKRRYRTNGISVFYVR